jgi:hypothetical protein
LYSRRMSCKTKIMTTFMSNTKSAALINQDMNVNDYAQPREADPNSRQ